MELDAAGALRTLRFAFILGAKPFLFLSTDFLYIKVSYFILFFFVAVEDLENTLLMPIEVSDDMEIKYNEGSDCKE